MWYIFWQNQTCPAIKWLLVGQYLSHESTLYWAKTRSTLP